MRPAPAREPHPDEPTAGDHDRASCFLSMVLGRRVDRGLYVDQLAHMLADERAHERERLTLQDRVAADQAARVTAELDRMRVAGVAHLPTSAAHRHAVPVPRVSYEHTAEVDALR